MLVSAALALSLVSNLGDNFDANMSEITIVDCLAITEDAERLACYDRAASLLRSAMQASGQQKSSELANLGDVPSRPNLDLTAPTPSPNEDFGLTKPAAASTDSITEKVSILSLRRYGDAVIVLENGQVWEQISSDSTRIILPRKEVDYQATIKRAALGSFKMTLEPMGKTIRVRRVK